MLPLYPQETHTHNVLETTKKIQQVRKNLARKIHNAVRHLEEALGPYVNEITPSFLAVHYAYIIGMAVLGSIIVWSYDNVKYIDALFMSVCSTTQAGLNTVDINSLKFYQQITFCVICVLTTPIFMHSSLCLVRLYWFERHFDNIKESSRLDFERRRVATLSARSESAISFGRIVEEDIDVLSTKLPPSLSFELSDEFQNDASDLEYQYCKDMIDPKDVMISIGLTQERRDSNDELPSALVISGPAERSGFSSDYKKKFQSLSKKSTEANARNDYREKIPEKVKYESQTSISDFHLGMKFIKRANHTNPYEEELDFSKRCTQPQRQRRHSGTEEDDNSHDMKSSLKRQMLTNYLSWTPSIGRNSTFLNLSDQQREELGGVEFRAIKLLSKILVLYYIGFHIVGAIFLVPWILRSSKYQLIVQDSGINYIWWGVFTSSSSFCNLGLTLTSNSMLSFNDSPFALLIMSFLIIVGNTGFPVLLRFIIWLMFKSSRGLSQFHESLGFLLDHPRRCFTLLFPSTATWWLFFILTLFNALDLVLFILLDLNAEVVKELSPRQKILDGIFQSISIRTAGFYCIDISRLQPAVQLGYLIMMYLSVLPLAISIRRTNVYEEQVFRACGTDDYENVNEMNSTSLIASHLRRQLSFDTWFIVIGVFVICITEGSKVKDPLMPAFSVFSVMFEVVSAYGTVGLSLGYPDTSLSLSSQYTTFSKLILIIMIIRGRHRGLPYSLDRAVMLPSQKMDQTDKEQDICRIEPRIR